MAARECGIFPRLGFFNYGIGSTMGDELGELIEIRYSVIARAFEITLSLWLIFKGFKGKATL